MGNSAVNDILMDDEEEEITSSQNNFQDAVRELGKMLFEKYPEKTSNLSQDNINGIIRANAINEYTEGAFGYRYRTLDKLVSDKQKLVVSHNGLGMDKLIEIVKSIQASFEQIQPTNALKGMFK